MQRKRVLLDTERGSAPRAPEHMSVVRAALTGAGAGIVGSAVMAVVFKAGDKLLLPERADHRMPPVALVDTEAEKHGVNLTDTEATTVGLAAHLGYGALLGTIFGVLQNRIHGPAVLDGLAVAGTAYLTGYLEGGIMPASGTLQPATRQPITKAAIPIAAHLVFGVTMALAFDRLSRLTQG
ncbi:MAG: hypothetical protein ACR2GG_06425 [Gemmatimonadaceae bacterium]